MSFRSIRGQDEAIALLKNALKYNRLSCAYIFFGSKGVGKFTTAIEFAKSINCLNALGPDVEPCDSCNSCKRIDNMNHPDLSHLSPVGQTNVTIKIDHIRHLISSISLRPYQAKRKVAIIDGADSMTQEASNALLKTLEEPPKDSILILITSNIDAVLPTITSRCHLIRFSVIPIEKLKEMLIKEYSIDERRAHYIAHYSSGRPGEAIRLKDSDIFVEKNRIIDVLLSRSGFSVAGFENAGREELENILHVALSWYRDLLVARTGMEIPEVIINADRVQDIKRVAEKVRLEHLIDSIKYIIECQRYLERNANPKLILSTLDLRIRVGLRGPAHSFYVL